MMEDVTFVPPTCPHCGEELDVVYETTYDTYTFDPKTGSYKEDGVANIVCGYCEGDLRDTPEFEDGMCNYVHPSKMKGDTIALEIAKRLVERGPEHYHREFHLWPEHTYRIDIELWSGECLGYAAKERGLDFEKWETEDWDEFAPTAIGSALARDVTDLENKGWHILTQGLEDTQEYGSTIIVARRKGA